ncbi:iron-sulfur cluster assembly protein [Alphaproteobacteria bacterium]|jgi:metal-sulfur cluster biosynthetic enzyme|nr:iron-sulfur cluster assembly protein [Alphaproteobacteria bacterium]MDA8711371.1 iron-sulfur cluster assembly protein [Alphaproteobacteria bacterium]MDB0031955.1 iron-sulfur cluster assembly protein [Alphaproteobacteria bacterium]MDB0034239.1 iron-sulfur cluster assembly protein [Alphaproteobacteria bacterium]MDB2371510.1 iron-sulfur cluster assembly protein [Alphaproteobacteria bacterium]|tara:strand:+ start:2872 stop:3261 length:390 start_codon:yes stop_codon:yes gene_type:complete
MDDKTLSDFMPKTNSEGEIIYGEFSSQSAVKITTNEIIKRLLTIKDPELGINIYDLGLIYDIQIDQSNNIKITMTLTTVNCPVADSFPLDIAKNITSMENTGQVKVKLTFDPPWNKDMMSDDARLALGY